MIKKKLTFILMKTNSSKAGKLYAMEYAGRTVISRKSMKVDVPYRDWDKGRILVKANNPDANSINALISDKKREFERMNIDIPMGDDNLCILNYMASRISYSGLTLSSQRKYNIILKNFEDVVYNRFKMSSLPLKALRDISFVRKLKQEIRVNLRGDIPFKSNRAWHNYMVVFCRFVEDWNSNSGTQFPINTRPFTTEIGKDQKKIATTLTHEELQKLIEYKPEGYGNGRSQLLSKNIFLFQYNTGGIRIQDALTLTNKEIKSDGFQIKIQKTKETEKFPFCYEQVECLESYYPSEYEETLKQIKVGELPLTPSVIIDLNRLEGIPTLNALGLQEFGKIINTLKGMLQENEEIQQVFESFLKVDDLLKQEVSRYFFNLVRKRPQAFLFPKLKWTEFKDAYNAKGDRLFTETHEALIHKAEAGHNNPLRRISENLDISKITGHTPRHTLAGHLQAEGFSVEEIQRVLVHSNSNTTKVYLKQRHQTDSVNQTMAVSIKIFRSKRTETIQRRY